MTTQESEGETAKPRPKRGLFYKVRVTFLLIILACVLLYAWKDHQRRTARNEWKRPIVVGFVVVSDEWIDPAAVEAMRARVPALEERLRAEMERYTHRDFSPFDIQVIGPITGHAGPPEAPSTDSFVDSVEYQWHLDRWVSSVDAAAKASPDAYAPGGFDTRIYLYATPPVSTERKEIEGASEKGGRVGVVRVELDDTMADLTLFVASHELMHTLGASDKYAPDGSILVPDGLPEPELSPLYPQRFAELMARHRATAPGQSTPPKTLDELAIGPKTAAEIGWIALPGEKP